MAEFAIANERSSGPARIEGSFDGGQVSMRFPPLRNDFEDFGEKKKLRLISQRGFQIILNLGLQKLLIKVHREADPSFDVQLGFEVGNNYAGKVLR